MTAKHCLPKNRGKMKNLSISMVYFRISYTLLWAKIVLIENKGTILFHFLVMLKSMSIVFQIGHIWNMITPKIFEVITLISITIHRFQCAISLQINECLNCHRSQFYVDFTLLHRKCIEIRWSVNIWTFQFKLAVICTVIIRISALNAY